MSDNHFSTTTLQPLEAHLPKELFVYLRCLAKHGFSMFSDRCAERRPVKTAASAKGHEDDIFRQFLKTVAPGRTIMWSLEAVKQERILSAPLLRIPPKRLCPKSRIVHDERGINILDLRDEQCPVPPTVLPRIANVARRILALALELPGIDVLMPKAT